MTTTYSRKEIAMRITDKFRKSTNPTLTLSTSDIDTYNKVAFEVALQLQKPKSERTPLSDLNVTDDEISIYVNVSALFDSYVKMAAPVAPKLDPVVAAAIALPTAV